MKGKSDIANNPNDWSDDPRHIINLIKRIMTVSIVAMKAMISSHR